MDSSRLTLAILSQNNRTIGLFEHVRIDDTVWSHSISYFNPCNSPLQQFVRPRAELIYDTEQDGIHSENLGVVVQNNEGFTVQGPQPHAIQMATLFRLPFRASFWETLEDYPVYALNPDYLLPWMSTVTSVTHLPGLTTYEPSHYRLQASPLSSPRYSQPSSPRSPKRNVSSMKRTLSTTAVCPITLGALSMTTVYWTPCGHTFSSAIEEALHRDPRCPMCRRACRFSECVLPNAS